MFGIGNRKMIARQRALVVAYKQTFNGDQGQEVLKDLMHQFHIFNEHEGKEYDEGQRSVILYIMKTVGISAEKFREIFDEALDGNRVE